MKRLAVMLVAIVLPLAGCAGANSGDTPRNLEDAPRNYIVFFAEGSAVLDDAAKGVVAQAAQDSLQFRPTRVDISGYSGEGPEPLVRPELAEQRYSVVANALIA